MPCFTADSLTSLSLLILKSVKNPTHNKGHTLDLVLSYGVFLIILNNIDLIDFNVSDQKSVTFHTAILLPAQRPSTFIHSRSFISKRPAVSAINSYMPLLQIPQITMVSLSMI